MRMWVALLLLSPLASIPSPSRAQEGVVENVGPIVLTYPEGPPPEIRNTTPVQVLGPLETVRGPRIVEVYVGFTPFQRDDGEYSEVDGTSLVAARITDASGVSWVSSGEFNVGLLDDFEGITRRGRAAIHFETTSRGMRIAVEEDTYWDFAGCEPRAFYTSTIEQLSYGGCEEFDGSHRKRDRLACEWEPALDTLVCAGHTEYGAPGRAIRRQVRRRFRADTGEVLERAGAAPPLEDVARTRPRTPSPAASGEIVLHAATLVGPVRDTEFEVLYDFQTEALVVVGFRRGRVMGVWTEPWVRWRRFEDGGPIETSLRFEATEIFRNRSGLSIHQLVLTEGEVRDVVWIGIDEGRGAPFIDFLRVASNRASAGTCGELEFPATALSIVDEANTRSVFAKRIEEQGAFTVTRREPNSPTAWVFVSHVRWRRGFDTELEEPVGEKPAWIVGVDERTGRLTKKAWEESDSPLW